MQLIDTHAHIYAEEFDSDRAEVVARATEAGVVALVLPAIDGESNERMFELSRALPNAYPFIGLHPTSVNDNPRWREELEEVERLLKACNGGGSTAPIGSPERPVERFYGVGEVGLDFYWSSDFVAEQTECFRRQVELAIEYDLPLIVHTRSAWDLARGCRPMSASRLSEGLLWALVACQPTKKALWPRVSPTSTWRISSSKPIRPTLRPYHSGVSATSLHTLPMCALVWPS